MKFHEKTPPKLDGVVWKCNQMFRLIVGIVLAQINVADHVEVVVVDVDNFDRVLINQRVGERPTDNLSFGVVNRALVVSMVQLSRSDQGNNSWRIDVVRDLFLDHRHVVSLDFVHKWQSTLHFVGSFHRPPDFVVTGLIQGDRRAPRK